MSSRTARASIVGFLLIVGAAGSYVGVDTYQRQAEVFTHERAVLALLDTMLASVNELAVTQRGYFEPAPEGNSSRSSAPQFQRVQQLTEELRERLTSLRSLVTEPEAVELVPSLAAALDAFSTTDTRVRTNLANDTYFSAADLVFSASSAELRSVTSALIDLKGLTTQGALAQYDRLRRRTALSAGAVGLVWIFGLLLLVWPGSQNPATDGLAGDPLAQADQGIALVGHTLLASAAPEVQHQARPAVDLEAAANVCVSMAKATSAADLRELMAAASSAVGASGMVLWLGAGEELFPVLGHGYDPKMLARIGPLAREASNATAIAWRNAETQIVPGDQGRAGAVVVPLISAQGCIGVLSAEVPSGHERDATTRSVTVLFAAQLATIVAAWPEPSAGAGGGPTSHPGTIAVTL
jgi:CHASE3 domain sensor protein